MKRLFVIFSLFILIILIITPNGANAQQISTYLSITIEPNSDIRQGQTALLRVNGTSLTQVRVAFLNRITLLHPSNVGDWFGFLAVDMDTSPGAYTLDVTAWIDGEQTPTRVTQSVNIIWGTFDSQDIEIPYRLEHLLDADLNAEDFDTLLAVHSRWSPERLFTTFEQPIPGPVLSQFGGFRVYNSGVLRGRHTGSDYRAVEGTQIHAASDGRVVFAARLPIHGNHVVIDHGWGVLSGYSHMSDIVVVPGQLVRKGDIIGQVGVTGRVQGPHLHFEIAVNGFWVDAAQFLDLDIPLSAPN